MIKSVIKMTDDKVTKTKSRVGNSNESVGKTVKHYEHVYHGPPPQGPYNNTYPYKKLYRSTRDKWLGGVCGGLAEYFNKDPVLIRILWVILALVSFGAGIIAYILFWIFVDKYPSYYEIPAKSARGSKRRSVHYHYYYDESGRG